MVLDAFRDTWDMSAAPASQEHHLPSSDASGFIKVAERLAVRLLLLPRLRPDGQRLGRRVPRRRAPGSLSQMGYVQAGFMAAPC